MKTPRRLINATAPVENPFARLPWRRGFVLLALGLTFALAPVALAVDPPPDGGYPNFNTAEGEDALFSLTTGSDNTAIGFHALFNNKAGFDNTAIGSQALFNNTYGEGNTAVGGGTLYYNTSGYGNTAVGDGTLQLNTTGSRNTATGSGALLFNTTGGSNTANGVSALTSNETGGSNTAVGQSALQKNTSGGDNTAVGTLALFNNTIGSDNIALGFHAGFYLTTGSNNIDIGALGATGESNTMRVGKFGVQTKTFIAGISGSVVPGGVSVIVDSLGHMGTTSSSARYKEAIKPMDDASEAILSLKPVTFRYKHALDPDGIPQFGLVAEQVAKVDPDLVARDEQGKPYTVRYEAVNAMLLNEFLKEHRKVEEQAATIAEVKNEVQSLKAALKDQASQLQELSALVRADQSGRLLAASDH